MQNQPAKSQLERIHDLWQPKVKVMTDAQLAAWYCESRYCAKAEWWHDAHDAINQIVWREIARRGDAAVELTAALRRAGRDAQATAFRQTQQEQEGMWGGMNDE